MINNRVKFHSHPDGTIQFIMRGLPPQELPGYEVDPGDPYLFHPILPPCTARIYKNLQDAKCCPIARNIRHCTKYGYYSMTAIMCKTCHAEGKDQPPVEEQQEVNNHNQLVEMSKDKLIN